MGRLRVLPAIVGAVLLGACAQQAPPQPGQRTGVATPDTGQRVQVAYGRHAGNTALAALQNQNYAQAIAASTAALENASLPPAERALNHTIRAAAYRLLGNPVAARADLDAAIALDPQNFIAWEERGVLNLSLRLFADAVSDLDHAIAIRPTARAYFERGRAHFFQRHVAAARADMNQAIALKPDFGAAYLVRGLTHHLVGAFALARADYQRALALNPDDRGARMALALLQRRAPPSRLPPAPSNPIQHF